MLAFVAVVNAFFFINEGLDEELLFRPALPDFFDPDDLDESVEVVVEERSEELELDETDMDDESILAGEDLVEPLVGEEADEQVMESERRESMLGFAVEE